MRRLALPFGVMLLGLLGPAAWAQELPVFDAHVHYNEHDRAAYSPEAILRILDRTGVRWALVSSTPDEGTVRLYEKDPARILPVLRPYRTPADQARWTTDASIVPYVEERLKRGIYKGIGEFHLSGSQADDPVVQAFARLAESRGLFLYAHTDAAGIEALVRRYPRARWLWAHAGLGEAFPAVARAMERNPSLVAELSLKSVTSSGGALDPGWRDLFRKHPDRFLVGSDTYVTSQWDRYAAIQAGIRGWLSQLPRGLAEKLASQNALQFVSGK